MADTLYTIVNAAVLPGWLLLIFAPRWKWTTSLVTTVLIPFVLGLAYIALVLANLPVVRSAGAFLHLSDVAKLFANEYCLLAGWIHYLAFDLLVGAWEVRDSQQRAIPHLLVVPCLILTFLFGPAGWLVYVAIRTVHRRG